MIAMAVNTSVRAVVPMEVYQAAAARAASEKTTVERVVAGLLAGYAKAKPKRSKTT